MRAPLARASLGLALALAGCGRAYDTGELAARHPELAAIPGRGLRDATPYLLPTRGELVFLLCRWPDAARIPVSLPPDASEVERLDIEAVLRAWEGAGLGLRFAPGAEPGQGIEIRFTGDEQAEGELQQRAATAVADCGVAPEALQAPPQAELRAAIAFASIHLSRTGRDALGRDRNWSRPERVGAMLHEFGHALGFQGHVRRGDVMVASVEEVRRAGSRLLAGERFQSDALRALYAVPSGVVVGRGRVGESKTAAVERLAAVAQRRGLTGPFLQVGDRVARILWRDRHHTSFALAVWNLGQVLRRPADLNLYPEPRAVDLLRDAG